MVLLAPDMVPGSVKVNSTQEANIREEAFVRYKALAILAMFLALPAALAGSNSEKSDSAKKRAEIDRMTEGALQTLFEKSDTAKDLYDRSYGYAVFDNLKLAFGLSGGGGAGVAVEKDSGKRTYMRMGSAGAGLSLGAKKYQVVFLFHDKETFDDFVEHGLQSSAAASVVAGKAGAASEASFKRGVAAYQLTDAGLMASLDVSAARYWEYDELNRSK